MRVRRVFLGMAVWLVVSSGVMVLEDSSALAFTTRLPLPFSPFGSGDLTGIAVDQSSGNVLVADSDFERKVLVFGAEGGSPAGGIPGELTGEQTPAGFFQFGGEPTGVAVDNACFQSKLSGAACTAFDSSNGDIYVTDVKHDVVDKFRVNGAGEYEYICQFTGFGFVGSACLKNEPSVQGTPSEVSFEEPVGVAVDREGNVYVANFGNEVTGYGAAIYEFNSAGEDVRRITSSVDPPEDIAVDSAGDIYVRKYAYETFGNSSPEVELKRSSFTGAVESETNAHGGTTGLAYNLATGRLFIGFGSAVEEYNGAGETQAGFGSRVLNDERGIAVNETTNDVYAVDGASEQVDAFGLLIIVPSATTGASSSVDKATTMVSGTVNPEDAGEAHYFFQYGTSTEYGLETPEESAGLGSANVPVSATLKDLEPEKTYHYRLVAKNAEGADYGQDQTFTTGPAVALEMCASKSSPLSAKLCGIVKPETFATTYYFEYGPSLGYGLSTSPVEVSGAVKEETVTAEVGELLPGTIYYDRIVASNEIGSSSGEAQEFTTPPALPTVNDKTPFAVEVALHEGTLHGTINPGNGITEYHFVYGLAAGEYTHSAAAAYAPLNYEDDSVAQLITGLEPGRVYHYALVATNTSGTSTGPDETFSTLMSSAPTTQSSEANEAPPTVVASPLSAPFVPLLVPEPLFPVVEPGTSTHKSGVKRNKRQRVRRKKTTRTRTGSHTKRRASR